MKRQAKRSSPVDSDHELRAAAAAVASAHMPSVARSRSAEVAGHKGTSLGYAWNMHTNHTGLDLASNAHNLPFTAHLTPSAVESSQVNPDKIPYRNQSSRVNNLRAPFKLSLLMQKQELMRRSGEEHRRGSSSVGYLQALRRKPSTAKGSFRPFFENTYQSIQLNDLASRRGNTGIDVSSSRTIIGLSPPLRQIRSGTNQRLVCGNVELPIGMFSSGRLSKFFPCIFAI